VLTDNQNTDDPRGTGADAPWTGAELRELLALEQAGAEFVVVRAPNGARQLHSLAGRRELVIGRSSESDIVIAGDGEVSRVHARLELLADCWTVLDDGISRNGTYVNGRRIVGRKRLHERDVIGVGRSQLQFHMPAGERNTLTATGGSRPVLERLSPTQLSILQALCRPCLGATPFMTPASNNQIAQEVHLGVDAVKAQMRRLFAIFEISDLPQNRKRIRLAELALNGGLIAIGRTEAQAAERGATAP
jgi:pSer/pThr/pTyr-binding forkhead associated (FHA) protein